MLLRWAIQAFLPRKVAPPRKARCLAPTEVARSSTNRLTVPQAISLPALKSGEQTVADGLRDGRHCALCIETPNPRLQLPTQLVDSLYFCAANQSPWRTAIACFPNPHRRSRLCASTRNSAPSTLKRSAPCPRSHIQRESSVKAAAPLLPMPHDRFTDVMPLWAWMGAATRRACPQSAKKGSKRRWSVLKDRGGGGACGMFSQLLTKTPPIVPSPACTTASPLRAKRILTSLARMMQSSTTGDAEDRESERSVGLYISVTADLA